MENATSSSIDSFVLAPAVKGGPVSMPIESGEAARQSEELLEEELHGAKSTPAPVISAPSAYIVQESITIKMDESKVRETKKEDGNAFVRWITNKAKALITRPLLLVFVMLFLCALIGLGVWGVVRSSQTEQANRQVTATSIAIEKSLALRSIIIGAMQPAITLGALIATQTPQTWQGVLGTFYDTTPGILNLSQSAPIINLQLIPNGVITAIEPPLGFKGDIGLDLLKDPNQRSLALKVINLTVVEVIGPIRLSANIDGIIGRYPIFVPDSSSSDTFGFVPPFNRDLFSPSGGNCPFDLCYRNSSGSKFWGFAQVVVGWQSVVDLSGFYDLCSSYSFMIVGNDDEEYGDTPLAQCSDTLNLPSTFPRIINGSRSSYSLKSLLSSKPVSIPIPVFDDHWTLWIVDSRGWTPEWTAPLIACVVIVAVIFSLLILLLMASYLEQVKALQDLQASNRKLDDARTVLEAEKAHTDALIVRQLNLISCFSDENMNKAPRGSMEESTLERIEAVRRHLNMGGNDQDEMEVMELLGSGSFGKVYRGLWRGSQVAIKTILLPTNMSGMAKREKMAIMEAAISSALTHPNIVQTFTYAIRPLRDTMTLPSSELGSIAQVANIDESAISMNRDTASTSFKSMNNLGQIFSYEIRLVLEYCDLGCLRDALDAEVFLGAEGFNFAAVLDTALDIARAMHHLHMSNLLHMDLKARNIMVKTSGGDGRGMSAKVADFGLSVSLDSAQTHASSIYQGTITHMAPEILMQGIVSKAADVYAFGITLWEMFTEETAFSDIPGPHLGHAITSGNKRPNFSIVTPQAYKRLAEACWSPDAEARPTFAQILQALQTMRLGLPPATPSIDIVRLKASMGRSKVVNGDKKNTSPAAAPSPSQSGSVVMSTINQQARPSISNIKLNPVKPKVIPPKVSPSRSSGLIPQGIVIGGAGFLSPDSGSFSSLGLGKPLERVSEVRESLEISFYEENERQKERERQRRELREGRD